MNYDWFEALKKERADVTRKDRNAIIEECARVAEEGWRCTSDKPLTLYERIAAAIRALKDKP